MSARRLEVTTALEPDGMVKIAVRDTGVGLAGVDLERIFTLFFTTKSGGSGVGLAVSQSIVEAHGGRLVAEANPGGGAVFSFTLPASGGEARPLPSREGPG